MRQKLFGLFLSLLFTPVFLATNIDEFTQSMEKQSGFLNFFWDKTTGRIYLEITPNFTEVLYVNSLAAGVGSNDVGLDRGQLGDKRIINFIRTGPKIFLQQANLNFRAITENALEINAVEEAFASSILWGFEIVAESNNNVLIELTDFLLSDSHNISDRLNNIDQGSFNLDASRSSIYLPRTKNFPDNTEFESTITFKGSNTGNHINSVVPTSKFMTVRTHHSFIRLPDDNYTPRKFDSRTGQYSVSYKDYASPLGTSMNRSFLARHRLIKKHPNQKMSEPVEPIIYYLDPGVPEPIRSALLEGASWWNEAFEAAGFKNAFRVEMLPSDADPMDVRYNTIQWVHRSTRGWSYGDAIIDPRTGEILKGHVTLGSLRVRQDMLIAQGLTSPFKQGDEQAVELQEMALARLKQLSAHEVGHTIGLTHNFAASKSNRSSVMDYPHPLVSLNAEGKPSLENAYADGIADWDKLAIAYAYAQFNEGSEQKGLGNILKQIEDSGIEFITDQDSRASSMAHPSASLWDNGADPVVELENLLAVRKVAIAQFGDNTIRNGEYWSTLEKLFVPIYLYHRYQAQAVAKLIGGSNYSYATKGGFLPAKVTEVTPKEQRLALDAILKTLTVEELQIPKRIVDSILPPAYEHNRNREHFKTNSHPNFDVFSVVESSANASLKLLLNPARSVRLIQQKALNPNNLGIMEVQSAIVDGSWKRSLKDPYLAEVQRSINWSVLKSLFNLASSKRSTPQVRAMTLATVEELFAWLKKQRRGSVAQKAMYNQAQKDIKQFLNEKNMPTLPKSLPLPPGSPIG